MSTAFAGAAAIEKRAGALRAAQGTTKHPYRADGREAPHRGTPHTLAYSP